MSSHNNVPAGKLLFRLTYMYPHAPGHPPQQPVTATNVFSPGRNMVSTAAMRSHCLYGCMDSGMDKRLEDAVMQFGVKSRDRFFPYKMPSQNDMWMSYINIVFKFNVTHGERYGRRAIHNIISRI